MSLRSTSFKDAFNTLKTMVRALPHPPAPDQKHFRIGVMNSGAPAPGMNTAARAAIRLGLDQGHVMLGIKNGFEGLAKGEVEEMQWMSVSGWASLGGSMLGTSRVVPQGSDLYAIARVIEDKHIQALLVIGGWNGYEAVHTMLVSRPNFPAFNIPVICLPASINNNLPGTEFSIGADTALNSIVEAVDKIKQSRSGHPALFRGGSDGPLVRLPGADGRDCHRRRTGLHPRRRASHCRICRWMWQTSTAAFDAGKRLGLIIRAEYANAIYNTPFMCALFEEEGRDVFDVRPAILGHLQQGGDPSPFDRIQATRLSRLCLEYLIEQCNKDSNNCAFIGLQKGQLNFHDMQDFERMIDCQARASQGTMVAGTEGYRQPDGETGPGGVKKQERMQNFY